MINKLMNKLMNKQLQTAGNHSTNIQAGTINLGVSTADVLQISSDVAIKIFDERIAEINDIIFTKLQKDNPSGLAELENPDFYYGLSIVQSEYARSGDKDLGDLLVNLLVERSKQKERDILQIVLNEALKTVPKLTQDQLATLSVVFLFRKTNLNVPQTFEDLQLFFDTYIFNLVEKLKKSTVCIEHLVFSSCGTNFINIPTDPSPLGHFLSITCQNLFQKGFDASAWLGNNGIDINNDYFFIPCLNDKTKFQVNAINQSMLEKKLNEYSINSNYKSNIIHLFNHNKMSGKEVKDLCVSKVPYMEKVFDIWDNSEMRRFTLTSVGTAIGLFNIKRLGNNLGDLSMWID